MALNLYADVKNWKVPVHKSKTALAKGYLKLIPNIKIVGIAGSVGKTTTQNAIFSVLSQKYPTVSGDENLDPTFRIPQTILKTKPWHKYLILEYGVEHPGEMDYYTSLAVPKYAVMTTVEPEHTKYFKNMDGVLREEARFIESLPKNTYAILNADNKIFNDFASRTDATVVWYGAKATKGVKISHFVQNLNGSKFRIHYKGEQSVVNWKLVGKHQLISAYAAATIGILAGLTIKQIAKGLSSVKQPIHRLTPKITQHVNILDDTYNSSPKAAAESIKTLKELGKGKKKIAVLGEMRDLGELSQEAHMELGKVVAKSRINLLITVGKTAQTISLAAKKAGFGGKIIEAKNTKEAIASLKLQNLKKSLILIKGSRHEHLERIVFGLTHHSTLIDCHHCGKLK